MGVKVVFLDQYTVSKRGLSSPKLSDIYSRLVFINLLSFTCCFGNLNTRLLFLPLCEGVITVVTTTGERQKGRLWKREGWFNRVPTDLRKYFSMIFP